MITTLLIVTIVIALVFDFVNGWNDSANAIATVVGTRSLKPVTATVLAAVCNFAGAFFSLKIADTVSKIVVSTDRTEGYLMLIACCGLIAAVLWAAWMTLIGMPISGSHSLLGGIIGAALAAGGPMSISSDAVSKFLWGLALSPLFGFAGGYLLFLAIAWAFHRCSLGTVNRIFTPLQILSASWMGFSHGTSDAQKVMGVIFMALVGAGMLGRSDPMPLWVILSCAFAISLGTATGGWRVIKTLGSDIAKLRAPEGFAAEASATAVLMTAAHFGAPVSTTHVITTCIMGVGATKPIGVKWHLGLKILMAWIFTLPCTMGLAALLFYALRAVGLQ